jgi:hypothetical protein
MRLHSWLVQRFLAQSFCSLGALLNQILVDRVYIGTRRYGLLDIAGQALGLSGLAGQHSINPCLLCFAWSAQPYANPAARGSTDVS